MERLMNNSYNRQKGNEKDIKKGLQLQQDPLFKTIESGKQLSMALESMTKSNLPTKKDHLVDDLKNVLEETKLALQKCEQVTELLKDKQVYSEDIFTVYKEFSKHLYNADFKLNLLKMDPAFEKQIEEVQKILLKTRSNMSVDLSQALENINLKNAKHPFAQNDPVKDKLANYIFFETINFDSIDSLKYFRKNTLSLISDKNLTSDKSLNNLSLEIEGKLKWDLIRLFNKIHVNFADINQDKFISKDQTIITGWRESFKAINIIRGSSFDSLSKYKPVNEKIKALYKDLAEECLQTLKTNGVTLTPQKESLVKAEVNTLIDFHIIPYLKINELLQNFSSFKEVSQLESALKRLN